MEHQNTNRRESKRRPAYTIRRIKPADFPTVAAILANAMKDDDLCKAVFPRREEYYYHFLDGFVRRTKSRYWRPGCVMYVAVTVPDEDGCSNNEKVVGHATWRRTGSSPAAQAWIAENEGYWNGMSCLVFFYSVSTIEWPRVAHRMRALGLQLSLCRMQDSFSQYFQLDKSLDAEKPLPHFEDNFPSSIFPELWYLTTIAVDPEYQRQGIGKLLTQRGIYHAIEENVPIGLETSVRGRNLYEKMGFKQFKTETMGGLSIPVMVWEPPKPRVETERVREWRGVNAQMYTRYP
ncbi:hypothetical protein FQN49_001418 [Arthroderma sp. PD_2]|nr:hypothetical protein FQN49_001418 [Arthroderma sp. PD_2]